LSGKVSALNAEVVLGENARPGEAVTKVMHERASVSKVSQKVASTKVEKLPLIEIVMCRKMKHIHVYLLFLSPTFCMY
jgi:hypothetical protein